MTRRCFQVPAVPVAQPRARAVSMGGKARMYGAKKSHPIHAFKAAVMLAYEQSSIGPPTDKPVALEVLFLMPRPKSMTWKTKPMPRERHTKKPDLDNLIKGVKDALNGLAWIDDSQVCETETRKYYAAGHESPGCTVFITTLED